MRRVLALILFGLTLAVHASYEKALDAMQRNDSAAVRGELTAAAQAGDARAYVPLARHHLQNAKSVDDLLAAQNWAGKAAATGSADGEYLVYAATVALPQLNFVNREGKLDVQRYKALAARPIADREDEMAAYDMLGKAAAQGHADATLSLAGFLADNVGEGNRARSIALLDKAPKRPPVFDGLRKRLAEIDAFGPTLATVRFFDDAVPAGRTAAIAAAAEKDRAKKDCTSVKLLRVQRMGPVEKPVWLPLAVPDLKQAYLMQGMWREIWTYDVCGSETGVILNFTADGMGAASVAAAR